MPFIDSKITVSVPQEKRDVLKSELGKAISDLNKPESYLMIGIEDQYGHGVSDWGWNGQNF